MNSWGFQLALLSACAWFASGWEVEFFHTNVQEGQQYTIDYNGMPICRGSSNIVIVNRYADSSARKRKFLDYH